MLLENPVYKTTKLKVEGNVVLSFLEKYEKVKYYYKTYIIIIDSNMPCSCHK